MLYFESFTDIELDNYCIDASQLPQRRMCKHFIQYLQSTLNQAENKIAVLYGLYSTGKSTMLKQGAAMVGGRKAVFIKIKDKTADFIKIIEKIEEFKNAGKTYFFIDEITMLEDFPYLISAIVKLCEENCTFSLSGNDSLQFYLAKDEELYDKHLFYHTTFLPYIDYKHINKYNQVQCSIDDYIKIASNSARQSDHIQKNNVHDYIYTAIARNIYNTLSRRFSGENLGILNKLYAENTLTNAIMKVIQNDLYKHIAKTLSDQDDLHDNKKVLKIAINQMNDNITKKLDNISECEFKEIYNYLYKIAVFTDICEYYLYQDKIEKRYETILMQSELRYAQIVALLDSIINKSNLDYKYIDEIYAKCIDNLFEEYIRYNTEYELSNKKSIEIAKIKYGSKAYTIECDMMIHNKTNNTVELYEIKHGSELKEKWFNSLTNEEFLSRIAEAFSPITKKMIIYNGKTKFNYNNQIHVINVDDFF